ncbi:helix-turn-helix domain-containing protein [Niameybacter massiliensis]|uniref:helix-turn-helix domain-containing protein n=1 Tax=Niameybacter massiliensis TaxID=1658108 RepID=UPI0006B4DF7B|nr:helix-turn-helix domain-containing protein [Niameybacter massiliensis]
MKKTISERIREGLAIRGMKQADLVNKTGIGKSSISTYISGSYEPKQTNIYKIAKALDVNEAWLMGHDVKMDRDTSAQELNLTAAEQEHLKRYRTLDEKGQHTVDTVLYMEYNRCTNDYLMPIAAHNDNINDEQLEKINRDIENILLKKKR